MLRNSVTRLGHFENTLRSGARKRIDAAAGPVSRAALALVDEVRAAWAARSGTLRLRRLAADAPLRVQLGSGMDLRPGWVNIDLSMNVTPVPLVPDVEGRLTVYINHDLRRGLPLPDESCEIIYSSHFFEHLDRRDGFRVMRDSYRSLRAGGLFRIAIPDFRACFEAYLQKDPEYFALIDLEALFPDERPLTAIDYLNYAVYQFGEHRCLYDEEKLRALLATVGFGVVDRVEYDADVDVSSPLRTRYSMYMQAEK